MGLTPDKKCGSWIDIGKSAKREISPVAESNRGYSEGRTLYLGNISTWDRTGYKGFSS
tara:strand:- start:419 stop:592 length:174 start_codon:yes stop_codon:yes gene_type:complete